MSPRTPRGFDIGQLRIDWPAQDAGQSTTPAEPKDLPPATAVAAAKGATAPALRLRWDFRTRFPQPTPEAVDAGLIGPEETGPEAVRSIHGAHANELLGVLRDQDAEADARRVATTASSGRTDAVPSSRLQRWYANLLGVYGDLFGPEAAEAFDRAVRAWHARVEVVVENGVDAPSTPPPPSIPEPSPMATVRVVEQSRKGLPSNVIRARAITRLPVPKPLPKAVTAGHFGRDENGPIRPEADEVRAITEAHAELLISMVAGVAEADRRGAGAAEVARRIGQMQEAVNKYAEDFGEHAAERLLAYARRQAQIGESKPVGRGR